MKLLTFLILTCTALATPTRWPIKPKLVLAHCAPQTGTFSHYYTNGGKTLVTVVRCSDGSVRTYEIDFK